MKRNLLYLFILFSIILSCSEESKDSPQYISYVDPFIGTGAASETDGMMSNFISGNVHPGALAPWGMVTFAPRNIMKQTDVYCGSDVLSDIPTGYKYGAETIYGFCHNLISGAGCADMGNVLVMPTTGEVLANFSLNNSSYESEDASPGYYSVLLKDPDILVESTVSLRTSLSRYTFKQGSDSANIIIDLHHSLIASSDAYIKIISDTEIEGWSSSGCFCNSGSSRIVHFVARFDQPFYNSGTYNSEGIYSNMQEQTGQYTGAYLRFKANPDEPILMKTGISYVSINNARENLNTEQAEWDFEHLLNNAEQKWENELSKIQVEGGSKEQKIIFYTALKI